MLLGRPDFFAGCPDASYTLDDLFCASDQRCGRASGRAHITRTPSESSA